jgi:transposase
VEALRGNVRDHHRFLIKLHLDQVDALNNAVRELEARVEEHLGPFRKNVEILTTIPGVSDIAASVIISENGFDKARFPTAAHLTLVGGDVPTLRRELRQAALFAHPPRRAMAQDHPWCSARGLRSAPRTPTWRAQFHRLKSRLGPMKAIIAVASSMLTAAFHMLTTGTEYRELTGAYFDRRDHAKLAKRLVRRLEDLGLKVTVEKAA